MFSDYLKIKVIAGKGGDGVVSFRREKYIDKGGPDGGDGGAGGRVIIRSDSRLNNLGPIATKKNYKAEDGQNGANKKQHGRNGQDIIIPVPAGTIIYEINDQGKHIPIFDFQQENQSFVVARGGKGGFGNWHFKSSTRQAPTFSEYGLAGEKKKLILELKVIADIGLIGLPNSGKSTFLSVVTQAKPKIADYPFTTIIPNLGIMNFSGQRVVIADIPGLIAGASQGRGLGHNFLRHVERTKVLLHLLDIQSVDPVKDYLAIRSELKAFSSQLARKKEIICFTKIDTTGWDLDSTDLREYLANFKKQTKKKQVFAISSINRLGLNKLIAKIITVVQSTKNSHPAIRVFKNQTTLSSQIIRHEEGFIIKSEIMERFAAGTDFTNYQAVMRIRDIIKKKGILKTLEKQGLQPGNKIFIGKNSFIW